jgi:hypothetical protein
VPNAERGVRHRKRFVAGFDDDATLRAGGKIPGQRRGGAASLFDDVTVSASQANLRFLSTEIDRKMLHGWTPSSVP